MRYRRDRLDVAARGGRACWPRSAKCWPGSASTDFVVRLNHRGRLTALLDVARRCRRRSTRTALVALDKLDKIGRDGVSEELAGRGIRRPRPHACLDLFSARDTRRWLRLARARARLVAEHAGRAVNRPAARSLELAGTPAGGAVCASTRAWRAGCRTTPARSWRSRCPDLAGSLGGGGRYDNLIGMFLGRDVAGLRFLARPRAHHRGHDGAGHVSAAGVARRGGRDGHDLERRDARDRWRWRRSCGAAGCGSRCIPRPTSSGSSSSTPRRGTCRLSRSSATTSGRAARWRSRICARGEQTAVAAGGGRAIRQGVG